MTVPPLLSALATVPLATFFAETGTLTPSQGGAGFAVKVVFGDNVDGFIAVSSGKGEQRTSPAMLQLSVCVAGMGRGPARSDSLVIAAGQAHTGTWIVDLAVSDVADGVTVMLSQPTHHGIGMPSVMK